MQLTSQAGQINDTIGNYATVLVEFKARLNTIIGYLNKFRHNILFRHVIDSTITSYES